MAKNPKRTVLLTLGRLPKALDLARAFDASGYRVIIAEPYRWHLCRLSRSVDRSYVVPAPALSADRYLDALHQIVVKEKVQLVVPVSEEALHVVWLRERLPQGVSLYSMPGEFVHRLHNKLEFPLYANSIGLAAPETYAANAPEALGLLLGTDCVVKPIRSCSGRGVQFLAAGSALPVSQEAVVLQRRVVGEEVSSFTIAQSGRVVASVVYRATLKAGTVAVGFERMDSADAVHQWIRQFVGSTGYSGFVSFDFIVDAVGKPWAIECNPRVTSGIHFLQHEDLAPVILGQAAASMPRLRSAARLQQFFPALTETQASFFSPHFAERWRVLRTSRDVTWSLADPLPLLTMPLTSLGIILRSLREGLSMGEVATSDIVWRDP